MSRRNRDRRAARAAWRCTSCGGRMHADAAEAAKRAFAARPGDVLVHRCGGCGTYHAAGPAGLRALTDAELFDLHVRAPGLMARADRGEFDLPPDSPAIAAGGSQLAEDLYPPTGGPSP